MQAPRNGGAFRRFASQTCLFLALALTAAAPASMAAEVRLLRASQASVTERTITEQPDTAEPDTLALRLQVDGEQYALRLRPNTRLGAIANRLRGTATAYEGRVENLPGSWAAVTRIGRRWTGLWYDGANYFGIDDAADLARASPDAARQPPGQLMVYRLRDAVLQDFSFEADVLLPPRSTATTAEKLANALGGEIAAVSQALSALPDRRLLVALIADRDLSRLDGTQTEANLLAQLNIVDGIFASQVGVRIGSGSVTIFSNRGTEPFTRTTVAEDLLAEVRTYRNGSSLQKSSALTHLVTGRDLDGRTVGIAYQGVLCNSGYSASLSQGTMSVSFAALVTAHEIGHVFGAPHDAETGSACAASPASYLMATQINGSQNFSACSLEQMGQAVSGASCLVPADAADALIEAPDLIALALNRSTSATITVHSVGNTAVNGVNLRIALPTGLTVQQAGGAGVTCTSAFGNILNCSLGNLAAGTLLTVDLQLLATTAGNGSASLLLTSSNDVVSFNNSGTIQLVAEAGADLAASLTADRLAFEVGATSNAVARIQNLGPADVTDAMLQLTLPGGASLTSQVPMGINCTAVTSGLQCGPVSLAAGASAEVQLALRGVTAGSGTLQAVASSTRAEVDPANDSAQLTLTVNAPAPAQAGGGGSTTSGKGGGGSLAPAMLALLAVAVTAASRRRRQLQNCAK